MGDTESQLCSPESPECDALICVIQLLYPRRSQSLRLADLGSLLPARHLEVIRQNGRLRKWILQYPIFSLTGPKGAEHVAFNFDSKPMHKAEGLHSSESQPIPIQIAKSAWSDIMDGKDQILVKPDCGQNTITEEDVDRAEDLLHKLLEHIVDLIDEVTDLRRHLDARNSMPSV